MDAAIASQETALIDGLDFKLGATANYVSGRNQNSYFPAGGSTFAPVGGNRVIRFTSTPEA